MQDADTAYANTAFIKGAEAFPARWRAAAAEFRASLGVRAETGLRYGPAERQIMDLFLPEEKPRGLTVFVHGGYWLAFGPADWSHLAAGALARGWACAMPAYTLAPAARITTMTQQIAQSLRTLASRFADLPITVAGHSAGGHLAARMGNVDTPAPPLRRVVPISPLAELAPLMRTGMNDQLQLDTAECAAESPARLPLRHGTEAHVWVGAQERPAFLWQARTLAEVWDCPWTVAPGRHHFDVIDDLADAGSELIATVCPQI